MKKLIVFIGLVLFTLNVFAGGNDTIYQDDDRLVLVSKYDDGSIREKGQYTLDKQRTGYWITYFPNGKVMTEAHFKNDKKHGEWKHYTKDGKLIAIIKYKKGEVKDYVTLDNQKGLLASEK
jgi:antitoxin component YwqK of YwqJK toxin-antitoxin module